MLFLSQEYNRLQIKLSHIDGPFCDWLIEFHRRRWGVARSFEGKFSAACRVNRIALGKHLN